MASHRRNESRTSKKNAQTDYSTSYDPPRQNLKQIDTERLDCLKFTEKEISKMPRPLRKEFRIDGCTVHVRKRTTNGYRCSYEIRYRRNGYNVSASARTLNEAKEKFIQKLKVAEKIDKTTDNKVPTVFGEFAKFWIENYHKRRVCEERYKDSYRQLRRSLNPEFLETPLKKIKAPAIQKVIDRYVTEEKFRAAEETYILLNQIFKYAVKFGLIANNPVEIVFFQKHERKHGKALTLEEEKKLLQETAGTKYQLMFAVALYTGMRPNEYKTAEIHGNMIIAKNSKRRNGKIEYKRIPIIPMLKPYLTNVKQITWVKYEKIRARFKEILPNHTLYDMRTTFYTHCRMCGVADSARDEMVGHSGGVLKDTYTDLPDEFLIKEAQKLVW